MSNSAIKYVKVPNITRSSHPTSPSSLYSKAKTREIKDIGILSDTGGFKHAYFPREERKEL